MPQGQVRVSQHFRPLALLALLALALAAASVLIVTLVSVGGCGRAGFVSRDNLPGVASADYWLWPDLKIEDTLTPAPPVTPRWSEFAKAAAAHTVLLYDFQYCEGHPSAVDPTWKDADPPVVTGPDYVAYHSAAGWHAVDHWFGPAGHEVCYLHLPPGQSIDASDPAAWRFPVGTEFLQFLYRLPPAGDGRDLPIEWRRMRLAGPGRGQMRSDGTRSAWVFESAFRQSDGRWRRVREDGQDVEWVHAGRLGARYVRPAVRPHLCAECHALAGRSPFDGPRGSNEVYSLGDQREMVWAELSKTVAPHLLPPPNSDQAARLVRQPRPPEPADRLLAYLTALSKRRHEMPIATRVQQANLSASPFRPDDLDAGRQIYLTQCAGCHGADARSPGPFPLRRPAPPALAGLRSARFLAVARDGRGAMPAWADVLSGDDLWRIFAHLAYLDQANR